MSDINTAREQALAKMKRRLEHALDKPSDSIEERVAAAMVVSAVEWCDIAGNEDVRDAMLLHAWTMVHAMMPSAAEAYGAMADAMCEIAEATGELGKAMVEAAVRLRVLLGEHTEQHGEVMILHADKHIFAAVVAYIALLESIAAYVLVRKRMPVYFATLLALTKRLLRMSQHEWLAETIEQKAKQAAD